MAKKPIIRKTATKTERWHGKSVSEVAQNLAMILIAGHSLDEAEKIAKLTHEKIIANIKSMERNHVN